MVTTEKNSRGDIWNALEIPSVAVSYEATGKSKKSNEFGMREM